MDTISKLAGCERQAADPFSIYLQHKQTMLQSSCKFKSRIAQTLGIVSHNTNDQTHVPILKIQWVFNNTFQISFPITILPKNDRMNPLDSQNWNMSLIICVV